MNKLMKTTLAVSLLFNLLLLGVTFGYTGKHIWENSDSRHLRIADVAGVLPVEKQQGLKELVAAQEQKIQQQREQLLAERRKTAELIAAKPFSRDAYLAQVKVIEQRQAELMDGMADAIAQIAAQSTDEERAAITKMLVDRQNKYAKN